MPVVQVFVPDTDDVADRLDRTCRAVADALGLTPEDVIATHVAVTRTVRPGHDGPVWPVVVVHSSRAPGRRTPRRRRPARARRHLVPHGRRVGVLAGAGVTHLVVGELCADIVVTLDAHGPSSARPSASCRRPRW